jgi:hypothetical protein
MTLDAFVHVKQKWIARSLRTHSCITGSSHQAAVVKAFQSANTRLQGYTWWALSGHWTK